MNLRTIMLSILPIIYAPVIFAQGPLYSSLLTPIVITNNCNCGSAQLVNQTLFPGWASPNANPGGGTATLIPNDPDAWSEDPSYDGKSQTPPSPNYLGVWMNSGKYTGHAVCVLKMSLMWKSNPNGTRTIVSATAAVGYPNNLGFSCSAKVTWLSGANFGQYTNMPQYNISLEKCPSPCQ